MTAINRYLDKTSGLLVPLIIFIVTLVGVYLISVCSTYFDEHKFLVPFGVLGLKVDVFGAAIPALIGLCFLALYFRRKSPVFPFVVCFLFSVATGFFLGQPTNVGLMSNPVTFSFIISSISVFIVLLFSALKEKQDWKIRKKYFWPSVFLAIACAPLAKIIVDLFYLPIFTNAVIGGNGLADGVLLSIIYAPLTTIMAFSLCLLCVRLFFVTTNRNLAA
jgi:hypothetical protein